jgi:hypothetical protein
MKTVCCPTCNVAVNQLKPGEYFTLSADVKVLVDRDEQEHRAVHDRKVRYFEASEYRPRSKPERDALKNESEVAMAAAATPGKQFHAAGQYLEVLYDRSFDNAAELGHAGHPSPEQFGALLPLETIFPDGSLAENLRELYGQPTGPLIDERTLYWEP